MLSLRRFTFAQAIEACIAKYGSPRTAEEALAAWLDSLPVGKPMPATVDFIESVWNELDIQACEWENNQ